MRVLVLIAASLALGVLGALSGTARADVTWTAPATCPDRAALLMRVEAELGRPVPIDDVRIEGRVSRAGARWRAVVAFGGGTRTLVARSCDELVATAALVIAMAIDAEAPAVEPAPPPPVTPPPAERDGETPPTRGLGVIAVAPPPRRPTPPPAGFELRVRAAVGGDTGALPTFASGLGAGVEVGLGAWSIDMAVSRWLGQQAFSQPDQGASLDLTTATLGGCRRFGVPPDWRVATCAGAEVDALAARPFGFDDAAAPQTLLGGGVIAGGVLSRHVAGPVWLRVDASASALLVRVAYREGDPDRPEMLGPLVHRMDWLVARGFVSAEVRVP